VPQLSGPYACAGRGGVGSWSRDSNGDGRVGPHHGRIASSLSSAGTCLFQLFLVTVWLSPNLLLLRPTIGFDNIFAMVGHSLASLLLAVGPGADSAGGGVWIFWTLHAAGLSPENSLLRLLRAACAARRHTDILWGGRQRSRGLCRR